MWYLFSSRPFGSLLLCFEGTGEVEEIERFCLQCVAGLMREMEARIYLRVGQTVYALSRLPASQPCHRLCCELSNENVRDLKE